MPGYVDCDQTYYNPEDEDTFTDEIKDILCRAIAGFDEPPSWSSTDGYSLYSACPISPTEGHEGQIPYGKIRHMSTTALAEMMPTWELRKTTIHPDLPTIQYERFFITNRVIVTSAMGSVATLEPGSQGDFARNVLSDELANPANITSASVRDYANLDNALFDLMPTVRQKWNEYSEYLRSMTPEDMRRYRAMLRDWVISSETEKTGAPKFWGITTHNQVWLVKAPNEETAVLDLEDHLDQRLEPLPLVFADPYDDDIQAQLSEKFPDGNICRLIPFSIVPWPDDFDNMTDEQKAAFDKLSS